MCQGMSLAWHWASVGLLMRLLASKLTLQAAVKTTFPRGLGYHRSIKWVLQLFPFIGMSRVLEDTGWMCWWHMWCEGLC